MARMVPPANLRESVIAQLRSQIVSGAAAPGMIYSVPSLANELGISTTPVREALLELSRSGLVEPLRNRGFRSRPLRCRTWRTTSTCASCWNPAHWPPWRARA